MKLLWISPNFNHYKAKFLNHLANDSKVNISVFAGNGRKGFGDREVNKKWKFEIFRASVSKNQFGFSFGVYFKLNSIFKKYDWILIPAEKKYLFLILISVFLKFKAKLRGNHVRLITYCHPIMKSKKGGIKLLDKYLTKFCFKLFDRIVFYTQHSCDWALENGYVTKRKAYWANNTIDSDEVNEHYKFSLPDPKTKNILFIGRLIPSKKINMAIRYFESLQKEMEDENLVFNIIGDGPQSGIVSNALNRNKGIRWFGSLVDEYDISPIMKSSSLVFVPGDSGLSINHAFCYGRPYLTLESVNHGPEISYLKQNINGFILDENKFEFNIKKIKKLLLDEDTLNNLSKNAYKMGIELSVQNWVEQIKYALINE